MTSLPKSLARKVLPRSIWTKLRLARIRHGLDHYQARRVRHTFGGFPLEICLTDGMAEGWYDHDWPELAEIALLKRNRLRPGARVFDLGAHQCVVPLMLAKIVGSAGQVVAVEANPHNAAAGRRNRDLNEATQLEIVEAAAAEKSGSLLFNEGLNGCVDDGSGDWGKRSVPCVSIDDLAVQYGVPDVLFIDVEGFEVKVLQGAGQTLRHLPDCFIEVHAGCGLEKYGFSTESVFSYFAPEDYRLFVAEQEWGKFQPFQPGSSPPKTRFFLVALSVRNDELFKNNPSPAAR